MVKAVLVGMVTFLFFFGAAWGEESTAEPLPLGTISGQVLEEGTGIPLPSESTPYTSIQLQWRPTLETAYSWLAGTNCGTAEGQTKQGCADAAGLFTFTGTVDGKALPAGYYLLEAFANVFLLDRIEFYFEGVTDIFFTMFLARSPVLLSFSFPVIPSEGIWEWEYTLLNQTGVTLFLDLRSIVSMPGISSQVAYISLRKLVVVTSDSETVDESIEVPASIPDGLSICVTVQAAEVANPLEVFAITSFCGVKGVVTPTKG